ncbi:MAG: aldo/keto reductase [Actinobacteria bacterium]|nr:MAG: aldo/keto reductase [Actinomycetota bacterium]
MSVHVLGRTGLPVSRLGLGLAALGRPGYINLGHGDDLGGQKDVATLEREAHAVLDAAYDGGIRYFDAARSYGKAEEFLASWLERRRLEPGAVTVGSKWGYTYTADWRVDADVHEVKDLSLATLRRQVAESLALLGPYLRVYQIHSATLESGVLDDRAVLDELARLRETGLAIGLTVTGPKQRETIERALEVGGFDTVQATWNLLERSAAPALEAAHAAGLGVLVKEALANGRLTARGEVGPLQELAERTGTTPDALALAAVLAQSWSDVVLSGAATVEQVTSNLKALELEPRQELEPELAQLAEDPAHYWEERSALPWN